MKINYLRLKNFKAIDVTLHIKELIIDFTKMVNPILLFIGPIGSCKTYILSHLQPFAYMGNVDLRHGEEMILEKKDGEKEIHFENKNGDIYKIHHYYFNKKKVKTLKSYIEKNGIELNPTGLVSKFNELIEIEFGIDIGFLKILRLGTNVNNLVRLSYTNRKEFAVKLLSEIDEYINDYKNAVISSRECNSELSIVVDKLKKFNGETADIDLQNDIWNLEKELENQKILLENLTKELYQQKGEVESKVGMDIEKLKKLYCELEQEINERISKINDIKNDIKNLKFSFVVYESIETYINELNNLIHENENQIILLVKQIEITSQILSEYKEDIIDLDNKIKLLKEIEEEKNIKESLEKANEFENKYKKYYENFKPKFSKEEIKMDLESIKKINSIILNIREFSSSARKFYYDAFYKHKDVKSFCINHLVKLQTELKLAGLNKKKSETIMIPPMGCEHFNICPFYKSIFKDKDRSITDIENDIEITGEVIKICDIMSKIKIIYDSRKVDLPYNIEFNDIINSMIYEEVKFFDVEIITKSIAFLENFDRWKINRERIKTYQSELDMIQRHRDSIDKDALVQKTKIIEKIKTTEDNLNDLKRNKILVQEKIDSLNEILNTANKYSVLNKEYNEMVSDLKEKYDELKVYEEKILIVNNFTSFYKTKNNEIINTKNYISEIENKIFNLKIRLNEFKQLKNQKEKLTKIFNETELVKNAVSSNKGIPLLYLNAHFGRARIIANRIIKEVCGDSIQIENIIINDKEFRIPYTKNNTLIPDVINASQGETSIISMALSFALIEEFIGNDGYNILLLDEIDGPLDTEIKSHLLKMLEKRMETMNCEQIFMITHSPLFENYPVDVFITINKDIQLDSYKNINIIN